MWRNGRVREDRKMSYSKFQSDSATAIEDRPSLRREAMNADVMYRRPTPPGIRMLGRLMEYYNISSNEELAIKADVPTKSIVDIREGRRKIDYYIAESLSKVFGSAAALMFRVEKAIEFFDKHKRRPRAEELKAMLNSRSTDI